MVKIVRRIGPHPHADGRQTSADKGCPDLFELSDGKFAVIGVDKTDSLIPLLPSDAGCGPDERIVVIDRHILTKAKNDIPEA